MKSLPDGKFENRFDVDMVNKLVAHSILYDEPKDEWVDGHPIGNGDIGVMVTGSPKSFKFYFNKSDVWDNRVYGNKSAFPDIKYFDLLKIIENRDVEKYNKINQQHLDTFFLPYPSFQPCGVLELDFKIDRYEKFYQLLNIFNGTEEISWFTRNGRYSLNTYVSHIYNITSYDIEYIDKNHNQIEIGFYREPTEIYEKEKYFVDNNYVYFEFEFPDGLKYLNVLYIKGTDLKITKNKNNITIKTSKNITNKLKIVQTIVTSNEAEDLFEFAKNGINKFLKVNYFLSKEENDKWWENFWNKSYIDIEDKSAERMWYFGLYLLGSCSKGGKQAPAVQGLWQNEYEPPSHAAYPVDLNIQMTYWPVYTSNHLELGDSFYDLYHKILPKVKADTKFYFGIDGAKYPTSHESHGYNIGGQLALLLWLGESAWICSHFWKNYLYSEDMDFLKNKAYPVLYESIKFYNKVLRKDKNGKYIVYLSYTPEQLNGEIDAIGNNPPADLFFIKSLYKSFREIVNILKIPKDEIDIKFIDDVISNISDYPKRDGYIIDLEDKEFDSGHRHLSHLIPIYPGGEFNSYSVSSEEHSIGLNSLYRYTKRDNSNVRDYVSFTNIWLSCISAVLGLSDYAKLFFYNYLDTHVNENLLNMGFDYRKTGRGQNADDMYKLCSSLGDKSNYRFKEKVFTVESNSCAVEAINLMLLQSFNGKICIFPACPWDNCSFENLRTEGGFLVSSKREGGFIKSLFIKSLLGGKCELYLEKEIREIYVKDLDNCSNININISKIELNEIGNKIKFNFLTEKGHEYEVLVRY